MTNEVVTLFHAKDLVREHEGGGVNNENIIVHLIPKAEAVAWLKAQQGMGKLIDGRVYAGLLFESV